MKKVNPFPSLSVLLPENVIEENDATVASYWKDGATCLLQVSSFLRKHGQQISAAQRLSERMAKGGEWFPFTLPNRIEGCEIAAAMTNGDEGTSWVHVYLVWEWLTVHLTVSGKGELSKCDWAWDAILSIRPVVM
jgi:hypothetical protein